MKTITIFEISKILNLSPSTVSRALKGHPDIASSTKARVLEVAKKLDYEPNLFAVSLRKDNSREIAIIAPTLSGFYYDSFISAVEKEAKKLGYSVIILLSGDDPQVELQNLKTCKQRRVAGIMLCVTSKTLDNEISESIRPINVPLIFFDKVPQLSSTKSVCSDDYAAAEIAARALLDKRKKQVLSIFGAHSFSITRNRLEGYLAAFGKSGLGTKNSIVHVSDSSEAEKVVLEAFEGSPPDSIFCMSDEILIGVMKAIQILKLKIPMDVVVIAISNGFFPKLYFPEIAYVETSGYKLGQLAMSTFVSMINEGNPADKTVLEPLFVAGGSL